MRVPLFLLFLVLLRGAQTEKKKKQEGVLQGNLVGLLFLGPFFRLHIGHYGCLKPPRGYDL